jgi:predicted metal-dependent phosphoesterase TrpH
MRMLRAELHCHTRASHDGFITPGGLAAAANKHRLDVVAITDHDTIEGALEYREWMRKKNEPVEIIVGEERTLEDGCHLIGLFLEHPVRSKRLRDAVEEIREQGGLVLAPHPFRKDGLLGPVALGSPDRLDVDGYEAHNAKDSHEHNEKARQTLAISAHGIFGGSDAHYEADLGQCVNVVEWRGDLKTTLRAMMRREARFSILGKPQQAGDGGRYYASWYHAAKKIARVPRPLLPAAKQAYRFYWNHLRRADARELATLISSEDLLLPSHA